MNAPRRVPRPHWLFALLLAFALVAHPQSETGGTVSGLVKDGGGRLFPALITLRNVANGAEIKMLSDRKGNFRFPEVAPGLYAVRVNAPVAHEPWRFRGMAGTVLNGFTLAASGEWRTGLPYTMRTTGSIPAPSCSYYNWLAAGGPSGGPNCLKAVSEPNGVITDEEVPISGLGASLNGSGGEDLIPPVG